MTGSAPLSNGAGQRVPGPASHTVSVPAGGGPDAASTVAVTATAWPATAGLGAIASFTVVAILSTTSWKSRESNCVSASRTRTVKPDVPGIRRRAGDEAVSLSVRPGGSAPAGRSHRYGGSPPVACSWIDTGAPTNSGGASGGGVATCSGGLMIWMVETCASGGAMPLVARSVTMYVPVCGRRSGHATRRVVVGQSGGRPSAVTTTGAVPVTVTW